MSAKTNQQGSKLWLAGTLAAVLFGAAGCATVGAPDGLRVALSGKQEVPPNKSGASGSGGLKVADDKTVSGAIRVRGMAATAAHIHDAEFGKEGPVIVPLVKTADDTFSVAPGAKLTDEQYADYRAGKLYVNVHSKDFPGGEVRSQLADVLTVELSGYDAVPSNGSFATGVATFAVAPDKSIYGRLVVDGVSPTTVKIHDGSVGENGGRVLFYNNSRLPGDDPRGVYVVGQRAIRTVGAAIVTMVQSSDGSWAPYAGAKLSDTQFASYTNGLLYVDVTSTAHPKGEIRAQLSPDLEQTPAGFIIPRGAGGGGGCGPTTNCN